MFVSGESAPEQVSTPTRPPAKGALIDIQGTLLDEDGEAFPGAAGVVAKLKAAGTPVVFASNVTSRTRDQVVADLQAAGIPARREDVVTTGDLTARFLLRNHPGARIEVFADGAPFSSSDGLTIVTEDPDLVVLGGVGDWLGRDSLDSILRYALAGVPLVAMHENLTWKSESGISLDLGGLLPGIEKASGARAIVIGKPSRSFFTLALASKGMRANGSVMVGDDVDSDVRAAQALGLTGVLVRTGKCVGETWRRDAGVAPDFVIDSVADLPAVVAGGGQR